MRYQQIGNSGLVVSVVGVGGNNFGRRLDASGTKEVVDAAIDAGITLFDTADMYGDGDSERLLGESIGSRRGSVIIATKFGMEVGGESAPAWLPRGSRGYITWAVERSLQRLGTDYIDLLQYHEPDGITPIEETLGALTDLVQAGKVRYLGCSNFASWQLVDAAWCSESQGLASFISTQERYHLLDRSIETEVVPACTRLGMGVLPYYPLANGLLSGKYRKGEPIPEGSRLS